MDRKRAGAELLWANKAVFPQALSNYPGNSKTVSLFMEVDQRHIIKEVSMKLLDQGG
jgi:hypothetical protein